MERTAPEQMDTKSRILYEAEVLFSKNGFSGTGIDEIAKRVGITKSVIYYHFSNKEDILRQLFSRFTEFVLQRKASMGARFFKEGEDVADLFEGILPLLDLESVQRLMKILLMEAIKGNDEGLLFELWDRNIDVLCENFGSLLSAEMRENKEKMRFETFFLGMMPMISFGVFQEAWAERYGVDPGEQKKLFLDAMMAYFEGFVLPRIWDREAIARERRAHKETREIQNPDRE